MADAVVVGSALVDRLHAAEQAGGNLEPVMDWVREIARAVREAPRD
jgi:tryptophan synthase alpha subunit